MSTPFSVTNPGRNHSVRPSKSAAFALRASRSGFSQFIPKSLFSLLLSWNASIGSLNSCFVGGRSIANRCIGNPVNRTESVGPNSPTSKCAVLPRSTLMGRCESGICLDISVALRPSVMRVSASAGPIKIPARYWTTAFFHAASRADQRASFELLDLAAVIICSKLLWSVTRYTLLQNTSRCLKTTSQKCNTPNNSLSLADHLRAGVGKLEDA